MGGVVKKVAEGVNKTLSNIDEVSSKVENQVLGKIPVLNEFGKSMHTFRQSGINASDSVAKGEGIGSIVGSASSPFIARAKDLYGQVKGDKPLPTVAPEDPAAIAAADEEKRRQAKRQSQVDLMTNQPGRGGTILTDNYQYQV